MAITTVHTKPHYIQAAYNPIIWSVTSDKVTETNFSYVFDLYVNGATGASHRIKQRPNPAGAGMVDVSTIMQAYCSLANFSFGESFLWLTPKMYADANEVISSVYIKAGEEYVDPVTGVLTVYNGSGSAGAPAYNLYSQEDPTGPVRVLPAVLNPFASNIELYNQAQGTIGNSYWKDYVMGFVPGSKFLKTLGNTQYLTSEDYHTLGFINWNEDGLNYEKAVQLMQVKEYNSAGSLLATQNIQNITSLGGGPQTAANYTSQTETLAKDLLYFKCGPKDFASNATPLNVNTAYYTVQAFMKSSATSSSTPGTAVSEIVTFYVDANCDPELYPRVRVSWLNYLGGRDYYNFTMKYEKTTDSPGESYTQTPLNWGSTTPMPASDDPILGDATALWNKGGDKSFNKNLKTTYVIESDWLSQEEIDALAGIAESPSTWIYVNSKWIDSSAWVGFDTNNTLPILVNVNNVKYTYKNVKQQKLVQASFELTFNKTTPKQNL